MRSIWEVFLRLAACRRSGFGPSPLCLADVEAFCRLAGITLTPWELETLLTIDAAALAAMNPKAT